MYFVTKKAQYKKYCVAVKGPKWPWFLFEVAVDAWRDLATRHPKAPQDTPHVYTHSASQLTNTVACSRYSDIGLRFVKLRTTTAYS